jgi:DNA alkylation damage repair protein AlkB
LTDYATSARHPNNLTTLDAAVATTGYRKGLRWATLGYSYDWTAKSYSRGARTPFPRTVADMCHSAVARLTSVAAALEATDDGGDAAALAGVCAGYEAQTAIVNYYPVGSMMCAHQDVSEVCLARPLVSLSLGCSAVFLMGTADRADRPHAFLLRSGDVACFTGPSRLAFHAVPRVLRDCPTHMAGLATDAQLDEMRININVRQVYDDDGENPGGGGA